MPTQFHILTGSRSGRAIRVCATVFALATRTVTGADYYVAPLGNDSNAGSFASPFATIQKAANTLSPGDTCYIRAGTYHEAVVKSALAGTAAKPITFVNYGNEEVILDGTQPITGLGSSGWTQHSGSIYRTTLNSDVWQLFVNGEQMIPARWPNARFDDESVWDSITHWGRGGTDDTNGTMVDHAHNGINLVTSGLDLTGAIAVLNVGNWATWALPVISHTPGTDTFTYAPIATGYQKFSSNNHRYFIEGKLALLDAEKEWFFDPSSMTLYLWAPGGVVPNGNIRGKVLSYAFDLRSSSYVTLRGLHFFGSTFKTYQCTQVTVEDCELLYPSCSKRMLGETGDPYPTSFDTNGSTKPSSCVIRNCVLAYIDGPAIHLRGSNNVVENCLIHHVDWSTVDFRGGGFTIHALQATSTTFRQNTMHTAGVAEGYRSGNSASGLYPDLVEFNDLYNLSLTQSDGAAIDIGSTGVQGCVVRYNWTHNNDKAGIRFDATETNIYGINGMQHHNVVWSNTFQMVKGDDHKIFNNTSFGNGPPDIIIYDKAGAGGINDLTVTRNNAAGSIEKSSFGPFDGIFPGIHDHNFIGDVAAQLRDSNNHDFRPLAGSVLIDSGVTESGITDGFVGSAPDQGAYEYGDSSYWIPGYQSEKASQSIPPNGATNQAAGRDLIWLGGYKGTAFDVYVGTSQAAVAVATTASPQYRGRQSNNIHAPTNIVANTTYYWRVDTITTSTTVTGDVWSFTMAPNNATPVATAQSLTTAEDTAKPITLLATDADSDPLTYSIVTQPVRGTLSGTAPNVTYTPASNYSGPDSFTFKANDGTVDSAPATVTITVTAVNDAPVAAAQSVSTKQGIAKAITLTGTDAEGSALTYATVTQPAHGTLNGTAPNMTYTSEAAYIGPDSFTFKANDGTVDSAPATITITVTASNTAPVATAQGVSTEQNIAKAITLTGTDVEGDTLTYTVVTQPAHGALSGTAPNVTYTPTTSYTGADSFTFKVNDGTVDSAPATVTITITPSTNLPSPWSTCDIGTGMLAGSVSYSAGTFTQSGSGILPGVTADTLRFTYQTLNGNGTIIARISVMGNTGTSSRVGAMIRETLAVGSKYSLMGLTGTNSYRWSRRSTLNTNQTSTNYNTGTAPNMWVKLVRTGNTIDGYTSADGTAWTATGTTTYTLTNIVYIGLAVNSGSLTTLNTSQFDNVTVTGTVVIPNTAPVATTQSLSTKQEIAKAITLAGTDADSNPLTYSIVAQPSHGTLRGTPPSVNYTPSPGYTGPDSFTFKANDGTLDSAPATVTLTVTKGSYSIWALSNNIVYGDADDDDHDGFTNLDEYAFGTDPHNVDPPLLMPAPATGNSITLTFLANAASGTGYEGLTRKYNVQSSTDLATGSWLNVAHYTNIVGADQSVVLTLPIDPTQKFYRLSVHLE